MTLLLFWNVCSLELTSMIRTDVWVVKRPEVRLAAKGRIGMGQLKLNLCVKLKWICANKGPRNRPVQSAMSIVQVSFS